METRNLRVVDTIAMEVIHKLLRSDLGDQYIRVEFDGAQGSIVTPPTAATANLGENGKAVRARIVDHAAKWLCVFCEVTLTDFYDAVIPVPSRVYSFTSARRTDEQAMSLTESYLYARATARLIEQILPIGEDDDYSSLLNRMRYLSLASDFGGSSNPGQHYLCNMLLRYVLKHVDERAPGARHKLCGVAFNVQYCEEHPNSTGCSNSIGVFFEQLGMKQRTFISRQWLEAMALRYSRLVFAMDARENTDSWDPRVSKLRENPDATDDDADSQELAVLGVQMLYPGDDAANPDRRKKHFDTLYDHEGEFGSSATVLAALLGLLVLLVSPSTMRWGTIGAVARHLSLLNLAGLQQAIDRLGPVHCGKDYFLYKGRNDTAYLNWLLGACTAPSDRATYSHQKVQDVGKREERLAKIQTAARNTGKALRAGADAAAARFGFSSFDLFVVRAQASAILAVLTYLIEMAFRFSLPSECDDLLLDVLGPTPMDKIKTKEQAAWNKSGKWRAQAKKFIDGPEPVPLRQRASGIASWWRWLRAKIGEHLVYSCLLFLYCMVYEYVARSTRRVESLHAVAQRLAVHTGANVSLERVQLFV
eukprot:g14111.t1